MIGFFDSGFGGLSIIREIRKALPKYSTLYLGDNARTPYGSRNSQTIFRYTLEGVMELFARGADLIILACNTSSSVALRRIQQEYLPGHHPDKRVLGIVIPTAEEVVHLSRNKAVGIMATEATVNSRSYLEEIQKINPAVHVYQQSCPLLVPIIESGELSNADVAVRRYVEALLQQNSGIDTVLLGCTHYALIEKQILAALPERVQLIAQGPIVARKLADYLRRHPEMERRLDTDSRETFLTTESSPRIERLGTLFFGKTISMETIRLG